MWLGKEVLCDLMIYFYCNEALAETVSFCKYLGSVFTPKLYWNKFQLCLTAQENQATWAPFTYQKGSEYKCDSFKIFDTQIRPIYHMGQKSGVSKHVNRSCINEIL